MPTGLWTMTASSALAAMIWSLKAWLASHSSVAMNRVVHSVVRFAEFESVKRGDRSQYPIAVTTYSVTEHWQTGGQTRLCPALVESMPSQFVEMSEEFAAEKGIKNGDDVRVFNNRGDRKSVV